MHDNFGRQLALQALSGHTTPRIPVALFTWGFDYTWRVAGLAPWELALGGVETWKRAYVALYERHRPDILFYDGCGYGPNEPELLDESDDQWRVRETNSGAIFTMHKRSLALRVEGREEPAAPRIIATRDDVDRVMRTFRGWGDLYLDGLRWLIAEMGDRALVLPHHSPAYICACYDLGFDAAMTAMVETPELLAYACDHIAEGDALKAREWVDAGAEAVFIADGWASCDIISPAMFDRFALPYQAAIIDTLRAAGLRVILWNEGDILPILNREAALPMDAFAFEQSRKGVEITVTAVRAAFGPRRCLFGNLDSEMLLLRNDPAEIAAAVEDQARQSGLGAPFILCTGSPIPSDVTPEAVDAMVQAARTISDAAPI